MNEWSKKTNTELATRVPLIIRAPWLPASAGARTTVRAELVDVYRTLVDLAGLDASAIQADVQGQSLAPLLAAPAAPPAPLAAKNAYSQIGSCACREYTRHNWTGLECDAGRCYETNVTKFDFMGYTMNTHDGWRFTTWVHMDNTTARVDWARPTFEELYNQTMDVGATFDYPAYHQNLAHLFPGKVAQYKAHMQAQVLSWY